VELEDILKNLVKQHATKKVDLHCISGYSFSPLDNSEILSMFDTNSDLIVIDRSLNCNNTVDFLQWGSQSMPKNNFVIVTSNYEYYQENNSNVVYFPVYLFLTLQNPSLTKYDIKNKRPYPLQCLSMNPWLHKTLNIVKLSQRSWFDQCQTSFYWVDSPGRPGASQGIVDWVVPELTEEEKDIITRLTIPFTINLDNEPFPDGWEYVSNASQTHRLCYIDYVLESSVHEKFVSEKIWKPILSGQLFLSLGSMGLIKHLEDLGIDTFRDIIDHSRYDNVVDTRTKIDVILGLLDNLLCSNLDRLWDDTYERRLHNLNLMYDPDFHQQLSQDLISRIS